jgi:hypothetical protein
MNIASELEVDSDGEEKTRGRDHPLHHTFEFDIEQNQ